MRYSLLLALLFATVMSYGQVVINEYSASNLETFLDQFEKTEDWIELHNTSDVVQDIGKFYLSDKKKKETKWRFPEGTTIEPKGYLVAYCSGRDVVVNGEYHTNFKLTQTNGKDDIVFSDTSGNILESYDLEVALVEHSFARTQDGTGDWAICLEPTLGGSNNMSKMVMGYTAQPTIKKEAGFYDETIYVNIENNEPNSVLRYTVDGTNPTPESPEYTDSLTVTSTTVVKARSYSLDTMIVPGKMDFCTYLVNEDFTLAVFSVAADSVIDLANGDGDVIPIGSIEYFDKDGERAATSFGSLNRHGQDSWVLDHRSIDWISRDEMGYSKAVEAELFSYTDRDEYQKFMFRNSGDDNYPAINDGEHDGSTHIRDEYVQTLSLEGDMKLDTRSVERVILFLNGQFWGVYGMREKVVDHDFTDYHHDQGKYDIQYLSTWGDTDIEYGGEQALVDWIELRDFILENDMGLPANYEAVDDEYNYLSLIDYMLANLVTVASDWLNYNTGWWRGLNPDGDHKKWGYILWDLDATFDYYINYTNIPNRDFDAEPCDIHDISDYMDDFFSTEEILDSADVADCISIVNNDCPYPASDKNARIVITYVPECCDSWGNFCENYYQYLVQNPLAFDLNGNVGKHEKIFIKLLDESEEFKQLYYSRMADLMNTTYSCENMIETLDRMLDVIDPEMPRQIARWGGSMNEWRSNVQTLRTFVSNRCDFLEQSMLNCYNELTPSQEVTLMTIPEGIGEIDFNTLDIETFPWTGEYFGGMEHKIKAKVFNDFEEEYVFSHWTSTSNSAILPSVDSRKATYSIENQDTLTAVFVKLNATTSPQVTYGVDVFPNPTRDEINVAFKLQKKENVRIYLKNILGENVLPLNNYSQTYSGGVHNMKIPLDRSKISTGVYLFELQIGDEMITTKVMVVD